MKLGIVREGKEGIIDFQIHSGVVKTNSVKFALIANHFAYIKLSQFQKGSSKELLNALKTLEGQSKKFGGLQGIILDLRFNPGGLLEEAVDVASVFLNDGIVVSTQGRVDTKKEMRFVNKTIQKELNLPVSVLINGASASASEIVAGALQDLKRATIMGSPSFGKGSVQTLNPITEKTGVKLTIAQYMTPTGKKIQALGIRPDVFLEDIDQDIFIKNKKEQIFLREMDLRNHLTASIETEEEKGFKEELDEMELKFRKDKYNVKKNGQADDSIVAKFEPENDYQVLQCIKLMQTMKQFENIKKI
jgi:carboxyl-terminal processing protease